MPVRNVRRRYIAFKVVSGSLVSEARLWDEFERQLRLLYGVKGSYEADLRLIEYDPEAMRGVLRCSHDYLTQTRATLAHLVNINGSPASIQVLRVSGTIRTLRRKAAS
jgi:RNase P/RNase MRP subunit POP5